MRTDRTKVMSREGYWRTGKGSMLPRPVALAKPWLGKKRFLAALEELEKQATEIHFKGVSLCRLCDCSNGAAEMQSGGWKWPSGYRHYIEEHNVRPSLAFMEFVLGERVE
jgi:hypothetical protein